jgi:nitrate reductase NapE component
MSFSVICLSCGARLNAPDKFIGKKVKCPKCAAAVIVTNPTADEGFEVVNDQTPTPWKPVNPKPISVDQNDASSRPKRKKNTAGKSSARLFLVIGLLSGIILAVLYGLVIWLFTLPSAPPSLPTPPTPSPMTSPPPEPDKPQINWVRFDQTGVPFIADFPNGPPQQIDLLSELQNSQHGELIQGMGLTLIMWNRTYSNRAYGVTVVEYSKKSLALFSGSSETILQRFADMISELRSPGAKEEQAQNITVGGMPAREMLIRIGPDRVVASRMLIVRGVMFSLRVEGPADLTLADADVEWFFDSFQERVPDEEPNK